MLKLILETVVLGSSLDAFHALVFTQSGAILDGHSHIDFLCNLFALVFAPSV